MTQKKTPNVTVQMWEDYRTEKNPQIRNYILTEYLYITECIAARMYTVYKNHAEHDDIISCAVLALISAIDRYDHTRGIKFETFASIRVRGAIMDYLRKQDWSSRTARKNLKDIENAYETLRGNNDMSPTDEDVAQHLGVDTGEFYDMLGQSYSAGILSMEEIISNNMSALIPADENSPESIVEEKEFSGALEKSIDLLGDNERTVISLYYYEGLKAKQIAQILDISESRVSQIHSKALIKLKSGMAEYMN